MGDEERPGSPTPIPDSTFSQERESHSTMEEVSMADTINFTYSYSIPTLKKESLLY